MSCNQIDRIELGSVPGQDATQRRLDLLSLPYGPKLHLGAEAVVEVTGLPPLASSSTIIRLGCWRRC